MTPVTPDADAKPSPTPAPAWTPDPARFLTDLEAKPDALMRLADSQAVRLAVARVPLRRRVLFLGMGSSRYAADVCALRLRSAGIDAVAELASTRSTAPPSQDLLVVAISAGGRSAETLSALERHVGASPTVALTNDPDAPLASLADLSVPLQAGIETGGVACRTFQHTGLILRMLEDHLLERPTDVSVLCQRVAMASADLLERRDDWLPVVAGLLDGPHDVHVIAPAERWSSAAQSALMFREGPRRPATACETADWGHVDVYLTTTLDYRALLLCGSTHDESVMEWCRMRGATVVAVGGDPPGAAASLRFEDDSDEDVALHAETLVAELVAARWWTEHSASL